MHRLATVILAAVFCAAPAFASEFAPPDKAQALEKIKSCVADVLKSGKKLEVWLMPFGMGGKYAVVSSDAKAITVKVQGNPFPQNWDKIPADQIAGIGKACAQAQGDAQGALAWADYCMATEQRQKAEEALDMAAQLGGKALGAQLTDRLKFFKGMSGAPAVAAAPAEAAAPAAAAAADAAPAAEPAPRKSALAAAGLGDSGVGGPGANVKDGIPYAPPPKIAFKASDTSYLAPVKEVAAAVDNAIEIDLAEMGIKAEPVCDSFTFLRRASLDLTGQIPSPEEVLQFGGTGMSADARAKKIEEILGREEYADHWATFFNVLLVGRRTRDNDDVKTAPFRNWLREQFAKNERYDKMVTEVLTASGDNDKVGPANYLTFHLSDTLPNTMAHLSQTFLGARVGCAQCHDHPFDKWSQQDFWGFAAFLANTRTERREKKEDPKDPTRVTYAWHELVDHDNRVHNAPEGGLNLPPKALDGPVFTASSAPKAAKNDLKDMKKEMKKDGKDAKSMAMDKDKKDMKGMDKDKMGMMGMMGAAGEGSAGERGLQYRKALAAWITSTENEKFAQSAVNRTWRNMFGFGLVEPVDDIRPKNPPSHPEVMSILANDFNASGRDWKRLLTIIANTRAYQRNSNGGIAKVDRMKQVRYAARAEVRPMTPEMLFSAILKATGGEEKSKALLKGLRGRDQAMMSGNMMMGNDVDQVFQLMQRFINTSTAEDRAGKLQFEGTVAQALMMMHSGFMNDSIKKGVTRLQGKYGSNVAYIFAATLGRGPAGPEQGAFTQILGDNKGGLEGAMWVLLNSSEFVTIH